MPSLPLQISQPRGDVPKQMPHTMISRVSAAPREVVPRDPLEKVALLLPFLSFFICLSEQLLRTPSWRILLSWAWRYREQLRGKGHLRSQRRRGLWDERASGSVFGTQDF